MSFDPAQSVWLPTDAIDAPMAPAMRGRVPHAAQITYPPAEVWGALRLRAWTESDAPRYAQLLSDPALWRYLPEDAPEIMDEAAASALIALAQDRKRHLVRAVTLHGQPVGQVRLQWTGQPKPLASAELAYWLGQDTRGARLGTRMVALFVWQCLRDYPCLQSLTAVIHRDNTPSRALARRLGFVESGTAKTGAPWLSYFLSRDAAAALNWGQMMPPVSEGAAQA
jgi:RimJ/RimL family protein N-acetyltransferase